MSKRDLEAWEQKYKGRTAEEVAKRVIVRYRPSEEELMRLAGRRQAGDRGGGAAEEGEDCKGEEGDDLINDVEGREDTGFAKFGFFPLHCTSIDSVSFFIASTFVLVFAFLFFYFLS